MPTTGVQDLIGAATSARPILGAGADYDGLLELVGDRRIVLIGEASHGTHEFYRERARLTRSPDRRARLQRGRGRGGLARRLPRQPLRDGPVGRPRRGRLPCPTSAASRPGCGATTTSSGSSSGCGPGTPRTGTRRAGRGSTAWTSTASGPRSRRSSGTSTGSTRPRRTGHASATPASTTSGNDGQRYGYALAYEGRPPVRERGRHAAARAAPTVGGVPATRRLGRGGRAVLRGAERASRPQRRGVLPADVPGRGLLVEPPRPAHGRHARRDARAPRRSVRPREGRRLGAQLARR